MHVEIFLGCYIIVVKHILSSSLLYVPAAIDVYTLHCEHVNLLQESKKDALGVSFNLIAQ